QPTCRYLDNNSTNQHSVPTRRSSDLKVETELCITWHCVERCVRLPGILPIHDKVRGEGHDATLSERHDSFLYPFIRAVGDLDLFRSDTVIISVALLDPRDFITRILMEDCISDDLPVSFIRKRGNRACVPVHVDHLITPFLFSMIGNVHPAVPVQRLSSLIPRCHRKSFR